MLLWLMKAIGAILSMVICYITNPIVVLFCDEEGELPGFLHMWQTWDDSCDAEFFMKEVCPSFLDYGYDEHYVSCQGMDQWTEKHNENRTFSKLRDGAVWTIKQKIQRYFCRVWWLTRNCAYGFAYNLLGADLTHIKWHIQEDDRFFGTVGNIFTEPWCYSDSRKISEHLCWEVYLGWKSWPGKQNATNCMIAIRALIRIKL